ncbi:AMP-binding protein [Nonomuraea sp. NBC_01738]|uniref:phenylacetate--CoA ligase family protein n=1 Tax=Nonomuraea sp. NBC_01738 TaxID=2976003 RepID=UPI002E0DF0FE|nr:AMP-binding protein [Nonomuraea sp. NBC_01738]
MLWNPAAETLQGDDLRALQLAKLQKQLIRVRDASPYIRRRFDAAGVDPERFRSLDQLADYPFFDKDLERDSQEESREREGHPYGMHLACDPKSVIRVSSSSGTTGKPTYTAYTEKDRQITNEIGARAQWRIGGAPGDVVMHAFVLSMWIAGSPVLDVLQHAGATTVPIGAMTGAARFAQVARDVRPVQVNLTPSYARYLFRKLPEEAGISAADLGIRRVLVGGEPGAGIPHIRQALSEGFGGAKIYDTIGHTHASFFTSVSCDAHDGMHFLADDYVHLEIVDPETLRPLPWEDGVTGEVVVTALEKEAAPAIRWREKDIVTVRTEPCACGQPGFRFTVGGRADDMLLVRGVNVFPHAIKDVVQSFAPQVTGEIRVVLKRRPPVADPPLPIRVELAEHVTDPGTLRQEIEAALHDRLRFTAAVEFAPAGTLTQLGNTLKAKIIQEEW